ncbi:MAG: GAF domain-containing protein [Candidatus Zixiibacteriota bacterium]|nr:MAG: GAF domain-containing protein [candidate division Zixibacteria bacterium]
MKRKTTSHNQSRTHRVDSGEPHPHQHLFSRALRSLAYPFYVIDVRDYTVLIDNTSPGLVPPKPGTKCFSLIHRREQRCSQSGESCPLEIVKNTKKPTVVEHVHPDRQGDPRHFEVHGYPVFDDNGKVVSVIEYALDITSRRQAADRQKFAAQVLELLNHPTEESDTIRDILFLIKDFTGFEAVGIRLREEDDFPYYETVGFPAVFVERERYLCTRDEAGLLKRDPNGLAHLECMCGNVIRGRTDSSQPFFTKGGSFWSNCTTELLASTTEEERQSETRNVCNAEGYESVGLIPLRSGTECVGLLQFNDTRKNMFTLDLIEFFEQIGASVGIALARQRAEQALREAHDELEIRVEQRTEALRKANEKLRDEIERRQRATEALLKTSRALKVLSECNKSLVRAKNEDDLLRDVCQIIVGAGRYRLAWVGYAEQSEAKRVLPVCQAGFEDGYLETLDLSWDDVEHGRGPTGTAIRTGQPSASKEILTDPRFTPWREQAVKRGFASSLAVPLRTREKVIGALNIYASEPNAFDDDEVTLLMELADDLAFGIMTLRTEARHRMTEKALDESEARYRQLVEGTDNLVIQGDRHGRITFANNTARRVFGMTPQECIGLKCFEMAHPDDRRKTETSLENWIKSGISSSTLENRIVSRAGEVFDMLWTIDLHHEPDGRLSFLNCIARDISDRKRAEQAVHHRLKFEGLIAGLSTSFINLKAEKMDDGINHALKEIGEFADVDRSYLFEFASDGKTMDNTYEWCREGVSPEIDNLKDLPTSQFPWSMTRLRRFNPIPIPSVEDLPLEAMAEKDIFRQQSIRSLILVPMVYTGSLLGFAGFDLVRQERHWDEQTVALLKIVGEMFVSAIVRSRAEKELREANEQLIADRKALEDKNIAMREVMDRIDEEKRATRQQISTNVEEALMPLVSRIKEQSQPSEKALAELLEQYLKDIASPFMDELKSKYSKLTPRELEICHMIKAGRPSKEIAAILNVSLLTVHKHREQIRNKLGLKHSSVNLSTYLQSL